MNNDCPFCKVLIEDQQHQIIERGQYVTAIFKPYKSVNVNILIISNEHIINHKTATVEQSTNIMSETISLTKKLFPDIDWSMKNNNGSKSDQTVFHLHTHIYSQEKWPKDSRWNSIILEDVPAKSYHNKSNRRNWDKKY